MKGPSLRLRITAWYVGLLAAALVAFGSFLYWSLGHSLFNSLNRQLASNADNIAQEFVARAPQKGDVFLVHEINETYAPRSSGWFIRILGPTKTVLYQSGQPRNAEWKPEDVPFPSYDLTHGEYSKAEVDGSRLASFALPYRGYIIQVARSEAQEQENLRSLLLALLLLTPLTLVAAVLGGYGLMSLPLAPVASLMEQAEHVGIGNMGRRLSVIRTGDELERLSLSLNRMIARLEDSLSHNQRFCADVSHEL
ncbi:MAG TPA: HAMP domain-containing protein, partial [Acidobacteriaceae bacterium]|nr:HAMP domain-containing protein [Acidobacteriaceae bacterium]